MMPPLTPAELAAADALIDLALAEDLGDVGDITSEATIPAGAEATGWFNAREQGVVAGLGVVARLAERTGFSGPSQSPSGLTFRALVDDGTRVLSMRDFVARFDVRFWRNYSAEAVAKLGGFPTDLGLGHAGPMAIVSGPVRQILSFERTALNFLQHLSGIATLTARFVDAVFGTKAAILDTRKTLPGWRLLEKYAVRCGGGQNHRVGLYDAVLIKDNHLAYLAHKGDPIGHAVASVRAQAPPGTVVEVEVDRLDQLDRALACGPDIILVDNFDARTLREAVARRDAIAPAIQLEASGGVTLETVRALAEAGVDRISVGALTHSAPALDLGLDFGEDPRL
jgi:nicotinate-nucleotide pyrophosphorylase (carboxylating)